MNIKELEYLLAIVKEGNLSKAAEKLATTQPNISRVVSKTEKLLDIALFNKTKQPWVLTYAGEIFFSHANNIINTYKLLEIDMKNIQNGNKKLIKLGLMPLEERILLPKILPKFNQKYPNCLLEINNLNAKQIENALAKDIITMAVAIKREDSLHFKYIPLKSYKIILCLPLEHELAKNYIYPKDNKSFPNINLNKLTQYPFIVLNNQTELRENSLKICQSYGFNPNIAMEVQRTATAYNLVKVGYGAAFLLEEALENYQKEKIACFNINNPNALQTIALAHKKAKKLAEEEKYLLSLLKNN